MVHFSFSEFFNNALHLYQTGTRYWCIRLPDMKTYNASPAGLKRQIPNQKKTVQGREKPSLARRPSLAVLNPASRRHDVGKDGNITQQIVVTGTVIFEQQKGTYLFTYSLQDAAGNPATATRTVTVVGNRTVDLNATVAMDMIWCPPGTFTMGSPLFETGETR